MKTRLVDLSSMVKWILVPLMLMTLSACAAPQGKKLRYFFPPQPDDPRVEWLGAYYGETDLEGGGGLMADLLGEKEGTVINMPVYAASNGDGRVYVADHKLANVLVFDLKNRKLSELGSESVPLGRVTGIAFDSDGNIYVADIRTTPKIHVFDRNHTYLKEIAFPPEVKSIGFIAIDKIRKRIIIPTIAGHQIYITDLAGKKLMALDTWNEKVKDDKGEEKDEKDGLNRPTSAALDKEGNIVVCDSMNGRIVRFSPEGEFLGKFGKRGDALGQFSILKAAAVDSEGHIYTTDSRANRLSVFNQQGELLLSIGTAYESKPGAPVGPGGFMNPNGISIDQNDTIYVADQFNGRFQVFQYLNEKFLKEYPVIPGTVAAPK